jgi:hypothetical protein
VCVVDEIAYYSATAGTKKTQDEFAMRLRDLVARGRAAGVIVVAATQRPSADIIPTSLRDLFGYRCAFRCTTDNSSDIVLGHGWASEGYSAKSIAPEDPRRRLAAGRRRPPPPLQGCLPLRRRHHHPGGPGGLDPHQQPPHS